DHWRCTARAIHAGHAASFNSIALASPRPTAHWRVVAAPQQASARLARSQAKTCPRIKLSNIAGERPAARSAAPEASRPQIEHGPGPLATTVRISTQVMATAIPLPRVQTSASADAGINVHGRV